MRRYLLEHGYHAEARGDYESALTLYTAVLDDPALTRLDRANAQTWRGSALLSCGRCEEAAGDLAEATQSWDELGNAPMVTVSRAYLAIAFTKQGRLDEAEALLDERRVQAAEVAGALAGSYHEAVAELRRSRGQLDQAESAYREQFEALDRTKRLEVGRAAAAVADVAAQRADWETAGEWAERAANVWREVAAASSYRQSVDEQEADRLSAGAIRIMASPDGELAAARDLLLSATERVPWNMWYAVNLAYAAAALGDWSDAGDAIDRARTYAPLPIAALSRLLADFRLREASVLLSRGEHARAAAVCRAVRLAAGPDLDPEWFALLALRAGDAEFTLGRVEAAAVEYHDALGASDDLPALRGGAVSRLAVVSASLGQREEAADLLRRGVDTFVEAGENDHAWWAVANAVAEVAPAPEAALAEVLHQVFQELIEGGQVNTFSSSIEVAAPPDWRVAESFTFSPPDGAGNLLVVGEQLESAMTVDEYVELQQWNFGAGLDSFEEISTEHVRLPAGHDAVVRHFTWKTEDGVPISQFQACFVHGTRAYTATGTTITGTATLESTLLQLVRGLTLREGPEAPQR
jgi:tetratricopeptide (TPR) repeat protein